ncbi:MAG TPA: glutamyl-tRNA reductase [Acidimicrobiales bacterium]|nr:glutamyl-tRNA reductase [Acidimicrobiales bacterium]
MSVVVIGLNHKTVPLDLLERMTVDDATLPKALADLLGRDHVSEAVVLSTCNRTEVYASVERFHGAYADIREFLSGLAFLPPEAFGDHLYAHYDEAAAQHLFAVAAGLDSAVLGESEILGQVRTAWERARDEKATGPTLNMLFRSALEAGKRARTETAIGEKVTSVSQAAVAMAAERLGGLAGRSVLVVGAGEMGEGLVRSLMAAGASPVRVANRTWSRASELAEAVGATAIHLDELPQALTEVDLLLTSTGATSIIVEHADIEPVVEARAAHPLLIVDIAVPRDVDAAAGTLPGVTLLDMDDLRAHAEVGLAERRREVAAVRAIIDDEVRRFQEQTTAREVAPLVAALRQKADEVAAAELTRQQARLADLSPAQREAVEAATRAALAKVLHAPTVALKAAAGTPKGDRLAEALRELHDL